MKSSLLSFKLDANLDRIWRSIGLSSEERRSELQKLECTLATAYRNFVADAAAFLEDLREQLRLSQTELIRMQQVYGAAASPTVASPTAPLREQIATNQRSKTEFTQMFELRVQEFEMYQNEIDDLFVILGISVKDRGEFREIGDDDLTVERLSRYTNTIASLKQERDNRIDILHSLQARISFLLDDLNEPTSDDVRKLLQTDLITTAVVQTLVRESERLEAIKAKRNAEIQVLRDELDDLYLLLAIDDSDRIANQSRETDDVIQLLKDEIEFLKEEKATRLPQVVKGARKEIARICDQMRISTRIWPKYSGGDIEEEARFLTTQLQELKQKRIQGQPIIDLISQIENAKDLIHGRQNQLQETRPSSHKLAEEERARRTAKELLPKLERRLLTLLVQFRETNGFEFEFNGVNYLEALERDGAKRSPRGRKLVLGKQTTLAQQILMEKMHESATAESASLIVTHTSKRKSVSASKSLYI
jgi:hypothetical protein